MPRPTGKRPTHPPQEYRRVNLQEIDSREKRPRPRRRGAAALSLAAGAALVACGPREAPPETAVIDTPGAVTIRGEVWADNWFAFHLGERLVMEDSTPIATERSFNAESFVFNADYPLQLNFVVKDFRENDTGLEYIGRNNQQMGDGGFIAQFTDAAGAPVAVTDDGWRCLVIHEAPLDRACEDETAPEAGVPPCTFSARGEPAGWRDPAFDDSAWPAAVEFAEGAVRPKGGYDAIDWRHGARLIWGADLETHNTVLCRLAVEGPGTEAPVR